MTRRHRVLLTVSGVVDADVEAQVAAGQRPRPDYLELSRAMDADLLDITAARRRARWWGKLVERVGGPHLLISVCAFLDRRRYDAIFTDGEQIGLPLALLCRLALTSLPPHVMIVHIISTRPKVLLYRLFRLGRHIDRMVVYSSRQQDFVADRLGFPRDQVVLSTFTVDTEFFAEDRVTPSGEPMICTAGLEYRDYATLIDAVRGLDVRVVIAAASNWSRRPDTTQGVDLPDNVEICSLGYVDLRQLYADARFVVMPLFDVEFQAGVTTILEAMAMGKAVVCSRTAGQTDVIVDGVTGLYVRPGDSSSLRRQIEHLFNSPDDAARLGSAARRYVVEQCDVTAYADRLGSVTLSAASG